MDRTRFRRIVQRALESLPPAVEEYMDNVVVVVEREPSDEDLAAAGVASGHGLFGLYVGVPATERADYHMTLPDRIVIFQGPLERHFHPSVLDGEIARTVLHEIAHHFGMDEGDLHRVGFG